MTPRRVKTAQSHALEAKGILGIACTKQDLPKQHRFSTRQRLFRQEVPINELAYSEVLVGFLGVLVRYFYTRVCFEGGFSEAGEAVTPIDQELG